MHPLSQVQQSPRTLVAALTRLLRELANSYPYPPRSFPLETDGNETVRLRSPTSLQLTNISSSSGSCTPSSWCNSLVTFQKLHLPRSYSHPVSTLVPSPLPRFYLADISQPSSQILSRNRFLHDCKITSGRRLETTL